MVSTEAPRSILVVSPRRIGDALLVTPLVHSLRRAYPEAVIDVLVFAGSGGVLKGNPDCNAVLEVPEKPGWRAYARLVARLWRKYDLAIATQQSDRSHVYAWLGGRRRIGIVPDRRPSSLLKRLSCSAYEVLDDLHTHTVVQNLRLLDHLGVPRHYEVVPPAAAVPEAALPQEPYAVVHPVALFPYKSWPQTGWEALVRWLREQGLEVALTGGPGAAERAYCEALERRCGGRNIAGRLSFGELAALMARARLYVGTDTAVTHLAAACGTPTLALYGPSNPVKWGPWPVGCATDPSPWRMLGRPWQRSGNVLLLQGVQPPDLGRCVPCRLEGCERHQTSLSRCLTELPPPAVIDAARALLSGSAT
jgi:heptosyltransferase III